ncbi:MAG TPA: hypothetical protein VHD33_05550 [Legionellaceae bacterium]|nr:hypothetical protein [Legionellaceae bacterium]
MFKWIFNTLCFFFYVSTSAVAGSGDLFVVTSNGTVSNNISITLCLNTDGKNPLSCQNYTTKPGTLSIRTTIQNKTYLYAGIKINTAGYVYSGASSESSGYRFIGPVSNTQAATGTVQPSYSTLAATNPSSVTVNSGQTATFSSTASGGIPPYTYQWQVSINDGLNFSNISGATSSSYTTGTLSTTENGYQYRMLVTDASLNLAISGSAILTVNEALSATVSPTNISVDSGQTVIFTATPTQGIAPYSYQWYSCTNVNCTSVSLISGATSSTYSPSTATTGTYYYQAIVTDATAATATTNVATLTVDNTLSATVSPSSLSVDQGQTATFTATPTGGTAPYSYQWYTCTTFTCASASIISSATSNTYSPSTVATGTYYYQAIVTDATTATVTTNVATLTITTVPTTTLSISPSSLALSVKCPTSGGSCVYSNASLTGNQRYITVQNTSASQTTPTLTTTAAGFPTGTSITADTCNGNTLAPLATCSITVTPNQVSSSDCTNGSQATPGTITISTGSGSAVANIYVLSYGCIYQGGFIYSIDDNYTDYPEAGSIGGSTAAVYDSVPGQSGTFDVPNWGGTGIDVGSTTYDTSSTGANNGDTNTTTITNVLGCTGSNATDIAACVCGYLSVDEAGDLNCTSPSTCYVDWYLPAICQLGQATCAGCACTSGSTNMTDQLYNTIGANFVNTNSYYWSSSENPNNAANYADYAVIADNNQSYAPKYLKIGIRCGRNLTP